jgi:hypothetical protein
MVLRGYDEALRRTAPPSRPVSVSPSRPGSAQSDFAVKDKFSRRKSLEAKIGETIATERGRRSTEFPVTDHGDGSKAEQRTTRAQDEDIPTPDAKVGEGSSHDVTDLILVVHGIGQGVCIFNHYALQV